MKIDNITLYNFGSYEGETVFDTKVVDNKNIVLIGGKNGAGKTTLFTAMRVCLYGFMSMGYKNQNAYYSRAIIKLINNKAKMTKPTETFVSMQITINNSQGYDIYLLKRRWVLDDQLTETFTVDKNGLEMHAQEVADFEKYLLSIIPPELFNLYFFDGEKIADFFLNEGSNTRIKNAFLTLCGYDTFDIMRKNFKRISSGDSESSAQLNEYLLAKDKLQEENDKYQSLTESLKVCTDDITNCQSDIDTLDKNYYQNGGITEDEWNSKLNEIKELEKKREGYNNLIKKWANDIIPFIMLKKQIIAVKNQLEKENNNSKYRDFCEVIDNPAIKALLTTSSEDLKKAAYSHYGSDENDVLSLSFEKSAALIGQINNILDFDSEKIIKCKKKIKSSINKVAKIRKELDNSNIDSVKDYMKTKAELFEKKSKLLLEQVELEKQIAEQKSVVEKAETELNKVQKDLEETLKKASINDISARAIVMLDKLQKSLYVKQIAKVESVFRKEISILMRKSNFIDDIKIDDNFNTHIYRTEDVQKSKIIDILTQNTEEQANALLGEKAIKRLQTLTGKTAFSDISSALIEMPDETVKLQIEIDKLSLSNGEKQIFIMALYYSLIELCKHEIPFIIDTPFARIDTEHRRNISKHFFNKLKGQVFILSTNEEISSDHVRILADKILSTYMLENTDDKRTVVIKNSYFEVCNGI